MGQFDEKDSVTLEELELINKSKLIEGLDSLLKPMDAGIQHLMAVHLAEDAAFYFRQGQPVVTPQVFREGKEGDIVRVFHQEGSFLGVGEVAVDGKLAPKRLVV
ncbi:MAG: tRNA pseudouridine55 synthase [Saprospiraceae bacterium]